MNRFVLCNDSNSFNKVCSFKDINNQHSLMEEVVHCLNFEFITKVVVLMMEIKRKRSSIDQHEAA